MITHSGVSVVVAATAWPDALLRAVVANIQHALEGSPGELIVSVPEDRHALDLEPILNKLPCRFVFHPGDSRSAAVNTAVANSEYDRVLVLEEDFFLPSGAVARMVEFLDGLDGVEGLLLECREATTAKSVDDLVPLMDAAKRSYLESVPRPIWNQGIALLCSREEFLRVRGFDERSEFRDHAGVDLLARFARAGLIVEETADHLMAAYHFGTSLCADSSHVLEPPENRREREKFIDADRSIYRNLIEWSVPQQLRPTLISVAISTRDRADLLEESIYSVLAQTFSDFEIVVVDDGSQDATQAVVEGIADSRVKYFWQPARGISAARNHAADVSRGYFTAVHDDDDLMLPWRLEVGLAAMEQEIDATYGSWVNFDDDTAEMVLHITREFSQKLLAHNGQSPAHASWLLPTEMIRSFRYDETLSSSVDHNLASRLMWSGVRWHHVRRVLYLRRVHSVQVSAFDARRQKTGAALTRFAALVSASVNGRQELRAAGAKLNYPEIKERKNLFGAFGAYLPDRLVWRKAVVINNVTNKVIALDRLDGLVSMLAERDLLTGRLRYEFGELDGLTWSDMVRSRSKGVTGIRIEALRRETVVPDKAEAPEPFQGPDGRAELALRRRFDELVRELNRSGKSPGWLLAMGAGLSSQEQELLGKPDRAVMLSAAADDGLHARVLAVGYGFCEDAMAALERLPQAVLDGRLLYMDTAPRAGGDVAEMFEPLVAKVAAHG